MTDREFSRRMNVEIIKDEPKDYQTFKEDDNWYSDLFAQQAYEQYLERHQPYRWRAVGNNGEPIAHGESYFNEADCINAVNLLAGDDTTVYVMPTYGDDRSEKVLRFGATDRTTMQPPF